MAKKNEAIPKDNNIIPIAIEEAMPDNYLPYAVEVARDRALPDVRDGLKPVHRRILYGAYLLRAFPDKPYYKSARIVGDILGKFHPHGDSSVYESMVILAQNFSTREPLIDGHGNWGSIDGDSAAAMRYTEARLAPIAMEMIRDIDKGIVEMVPNYSDTELEPKVLPSRYPNLLVNGAFGIAVGLATNIPPHNLKEVSDGVLAYIENPEITTKELMHFIKGPDLPTGGILIGKNSMLSAYETGEGKVTLRAKTSIEKLENGRLGIVITEFPYRRNKAKLLQLISEMTGDKRHAKALEAITDIRDESDRTGIRAVIELRKNADENIADKVLKYLFKKTDLQCNISFNMVALADGKPETMGLKTIIGHYVNHQKDIVTRRTIRELEVAEKRFHIVEGFIKAIDIMDQIIETIRASKSKKDASINLIDRFGFSEIQAEAILELMLYRLTGLEIKEFQKEHKELDKIIKRLRKILSDEKELLEVVKEELKEVTDKFASARRTAVIEDDSEAKIDIEELIIAEDVMVTLSNDGFIKRVPLKSYNRSNSNPEDIEYREGDYLKYCFNSNTKDNILFFTDKGNMYQAKCNLIPEYKWKDKGQRIDEVIKVLSLDEEKIIMALSVDNFMPNKCFEFITSKAVIKKTAMDKFVTAYSKLLAIRLKENEKLVDVRLIDFEKEAKFIHLKTKLGLDFQVEEPELELVDRNIIGNPLSPISQEDEVVKIEYIDEYNFADFIVGVNKKGNMKIYKKALKDVFMKTATLSNEQILIFTSKGNMYKIPSYLIQNISDEINIRMLVDGFSDDEVVLSLSSEKDFNDEKSVMFFTKNGLVKKTIMKEFEGNSSNQVAYKLKSNDDEVVAVKVYKNIGSSDILMVTKKGMVIKFSEENVSPMGRVASGVTGISLKEDDSVVFGSVLKSVIESKNNKSYNEIAAEMVSAERIILVSNSGDKKEIMLEDIKTQNRAGRGNCLIVVLQNDYIKEVQLK
ncbi:DNA topoisomerase IV subunit A [Clostridium folliculivorans]|uniref:DNA topoisomerase (ATP-hydrolyzing) n=1 Tax=Clostridium folliculivorans TaxID=2886038 RepID=A0A9W5XZ06_9CLOT|nr:DNA topoisomerase IV subunit A [Clostridium folliculivorans]GKU23530.1 DNA topoisomerase (ATP-hydrolyzing) [Clostridium folliculivorans]GKU29646.1 DNA topoisomerase (ATP-hydrolyzing) [Clostridium folliculivorans]